MSDLESRVDRLELGSLRADVDALTETVAGLKPSQGFWQKVIKIMPIITPFILAGVGYYVTTSITGAIEQKQLELSQLNAISAFMVEVRKPDVTREEAQASAVTLAAFGTTSLVPLIHELNAGGDIRPLAAEVGLRALTFDHRDRVCRDLARVLTEGNRIFTWKAHKKAIGLLGDVGDNDTFKVLKEYEKKITADDGLPVFRRMVSDIPEPTRKDLGKLKKGLAEALAKLAR